MEGDEKAKGRRTGSGVSIHAALKANQVSLHDVRRFLDDLASGVIHALPVAGGNHGRIETRTATVSTNIAWLQARHHCRALLPSARCAACARQPAKTTEDTTYYLLSAAMTPERFGEVTRSHWGIEN